MLFGKKNRLINCVLIVEDEPLVAFDTEHFLSAEGFEIAATVDRVADAVARFETGTAIDLVLVDIGLADGNGMDVAHAAHAKGVAVLFVTGECPTAAHDVAAGCLAKPYAQRDLLLAIEAIEAVKGGRKPKKLPSGFSLFATRA